MDLGVNSPLATERLRDRLLRRPLREPDTPPDPTPMVTRPGVRGRRRHAQAADNENDDVDHAHSPPNAQYKTSSPHDGAIGKKKVSAAAKGGLAAQQLHPDDVEEDPAGEDETPGVSMIHRQSLSGSGQKSSTTTSTPNVSASSSRGRSQRSSSQASARNDDTASIGDGEDDDDDTQPSGRISYRSHQDRATDMTPARPRSGQLRRRMIYDESPAAVKPGTDTGSVAGTFLKGLFLSLLVTLLITMSLPSLQFVLSPQGQQLFAHEPAHMWNKSVKTFNSDLKSIRQIFPGQAPRSWTVLGASVKSVLREEEPAQPSVLLLSYENDDTAAAQCLLRHLGQTVGRALNVQPPMHRPSSDYPTKNDLFSLLEQDLTQRSSIVLTDIQQLPGSAAMALHAFCDNLNAPVKRSVILMTLRRPTHITASNLSPEAAVEIQLQEVWSKELNEDRVSPLLSRIAVSVIHVQKEDNDPCAAK